MAKKILIVEDDSLVASSIELILKSDRYSIRKAFDGFQAGLEIGTFQPDLMVLDLMMPGMNGFEVIEYVQKQKSVPNLKIVVLSAAKQDELAKALAAGADAALPKPIDVKHLKTTIRQLLEPEVVPL